MTLIPDHDYYQSNKGDISDKLLNSGTDSKFSGVVLYSIWQTGYVVKVDKYKDGNLLRSVFLIEKDRKKGKIKREITNQLIGEIKIFASKRAQTRSFGEEEKKEDEKEDEKEEEIPIYGRCLGCGGDGCDGSCDENGVTVTGQYPTCPSCGYSCCICDMFCPTCGYLSCICTHGCSMCGSDPCVCNICPTCGSSSCGGDCGGSSGGGASGGESSEKTYCQYGVCNLTNGGSCSCCSQCKGACKGHQPSRKELAEKIISNSKVNPATRHVSGVSDNATAKQNLKDAADGKDAQRSCYGNAPCGSVSLDEKMLNGVDELGKKNNFSISEIAGGSHAVNSTHYSGNAVDVNRVNGERVADMKRDEILQFRQDALDAGATKVLDPISAPNGHDNHFHIEWK